ncbi:hypothetical protein CK203_035651 [Vitis vinifera]|uniref:Uncharacterized protein n=1 Tax=Vitis vinifera TaxID=29760 RepID=A0A438ICT0_VITVI|nr:hypothetical protein CK203_035651 [Vitis vinifera]
MPQATFTDPPATPPVPPATLPTLEDFITISGTEFRTMINLFKTLTATHNALFRQMVDIREPIAPTKETTRVDVPPQTTHEAAIEPSSRPENPALSSFLYFVFT